MGTLLGGLSVLGQQQEPFRSHLCERLISRKLQLKLATAKYGLEKSARTVQTTPDLKNDKEGLSIDVHQHSGFRRASCHQAHPRTPKTVGQRCCRKPRYTRDFCHTPQ